MRQSPSPDADPAALDVQWRDWPAARRPGRSLLAAGLLLLAVGAVASEDPWLGLVAALLLLGSTGEALLPARYRVDAHGAERRSLLGTRRLGWDRVQAVHRREDGLWLQACGSRPWLARRRSLLLRGAPPDLERRLPPLAGGPPLRS